MKASPPDGILSEGEVCIYPVILIIVRSGKIMKASPPDGILSEGEVCIYPVILIIVRSGKMV